MKHLKVNRILMVLALSLSLLIVPVFVSGVKAAEGQTLTSDIEVNGDYTLEKGELILGDNTMTVTGDFIIDDGCLVVGKGSLIVGGDFRLQKRDGDKWKWSDGALQMTDPDGYIEVAGSFYDSSTANYNSKTPNNILTAGTIAVAGDFRQEYYGYREDAFASEGVTVVMNGTKAQHIHFDSPYGSYFSTLSLENSNVIVDTMISGFSLSEDVIFANGLPKGICRSMDLNGYKLSVGGDMILGDQNRNDFPTAGYLDVDGGELVVDGNLRFAKGELRVNGGSISVGGDFRVQRSTNDGNGWADSAIIMKDKNDLISVEGSFVTSSTVNYDSSTPSNEFKAGTIEVGGDFRQEYYGYREDAFDSVGTKVVLNGEKRQQVIHFDKPHASYFSDLVLENTNIKVETMINGFKLSEDITFDNDIPYGTCGTFDLNGKTMTVKGNMVMGENGNSNGDTYGSINVNKGTLTVTGNLTQESGALTLGGGTVNVGKTYRLQRAIKDDEGKIKEYSWSDGALIMTNSKDTMKVGGSFYTSSTANYTPKNPNTVLTAGLIEVGGDFRQEYYGYREDGFPSEGTTVKFVGTKKQTVSFDKPYASYFYDLILENTDVAFETMIRGWKLSTDTTFGNGIPYGTCGTFDLNGKTVNVTGDMVMGDRDNSKGETFGNVLVNGGKLIITGNLIQEKGELNLGGGTVYVGKDYRLQRKVVNDGKTEYSWSDGALVMKNTKDLLVVKGSFYTSSSANYSLATPNNELSAGVMEVGGDFRQEYHGYRDDAFPATGTHTVVLNGTGDTIQTVKFEKYPASTFKNLILTREAKYYRFDPSLCYDTVTTDKDYVSKYTDEGSQGSSTPVSKSYTITFNPNGGKINAKDKKAVVKSGTFSGKLPSVTKKGYTFKGWYTKKSGGTEFTTKTKITKSMTVYARWTKVSTPSKTTIQKLSASSKGFTVTWKKVSGVSGYEIRYCTKANMKGYKAVTAGAKDTSKTVSKLSGSKKYYVVVYAYKEDSAGNKVYSKVSNKKWVKTKK